MVYVSIRGRRLGYNENNLLFDSRPVGAWPQANGRGKTFYVDSNVAAADGTSPDTAVATILAANNLATALCPFITPGRNAILDAFTEPEMRELRPDWDALTARAVPHLRSIAGAE